MKTSYRSLPRSRFLRALLRISAPSLVLVLAALFPVSVAAQIPADGNPPAPEKQEPAPAVPPQAGEGFKWGPMEGHSEVEVGFRWVSDIAGNRDMYRSMVNLGQGPKLLRSTLSLRADSGRGELFDRLDLSLNSWGGEPYNTMRLNFGRVDLYEFRADYRNLNYYNYVPTFSNPLLARGILFGQHSLNVTNRSTDLQLKLFPTGRIRPYFGYMRSSGFGPGFTTYGPTGNEFLLGIQRQYSADDYRGGVELRFNRWNLTLEQGYHFFSNDTSASSAGDTDGNVSRPYLGQNVVLDEVSRSYHDRTKLPFSKVLAAVSPFRNLNITARYVYSMADVESELSQIETGNLVSLEDFLLYRTATDSFDTRAKQPSHTASFVVEYSPFSRLTLLNHFDTRRYHITGAALLGSVFYGARSLSGPKGEGTDTTVERLSDSLFAYNQTRNLSEFDFDLGRGFDVHAGHRYSFVETTIQSRDEFGQGSVAGDITQQTGIAGISFRRKEWLRLTLDYENTQSDHPLTRTDLLDYDQFRFDWRVRLKKDLSATGRIAFLRNSNEQSDVDLNSHRRNYAVTLNYEPQQRFTLSLDYSRTNIFSNIAILLPQSLDASRSLFDERSDAVGGMIGFDVYRSARVDFGYRAILNLGSYPLNFHQPYASFSIPLPNRLTWRTNWQYFGYNEKGVSLQDYRGHLLTFSLAYSY